MKVIGYNVMAKIRNFQDFLVSNNLGKYQVHASAKNGHYVLKSLDDKNKPNLYVVYKRDWFMTFSKKFSDFIKKNPHFEGVGESINKEALKRALANKCDYIIFIHDSEVFVGYTKMILNICINNNLIRNQNRLNSYAKTNNSGKSELVSETTYSFPKKLLVPFEEVFYEK
jgi:hypothetical protein